MSDSSVTNEFILIKTLVDTDVYEEVLIPYSEITALRFGKSLNESGKYTDEDCLTIYHGQTGDRYNKLYGAYAKKVYAHLLGSLGLGLIYRIGQDDGGK